jgi:hypothetical protein
MSELQISPYGQQSHFCDVIVGQCGRAAGNIAAGLQNHLTPCHS